MGQVPRHVLPLIIFSQFAGTSLWFAGNAILPDLIAAYGFKVTDLGYLTSSVQLGFIVGTLVFAIFTIADKYSPSKTFFWCSLTASVVNVAILVLPVSLINLVMARFFVGFLLAGIYPIGMKLAADWYQKDLSKAIGLLVGALVLGTAFPHLIRGVGVSFDWKVIMGAVSTIALVGGFSVLFFVPDGPHRKPSAGFRPEAIWALFKIKDLRSATFGYFGHMWELYTVWAFVPVIVAYYGHVHGTDLNQSVLSFFIIGAGFVGCAVGGLAALRLGSARVAFWQLSGSLTCIALTPIIAYMPPVVFVVYMMLWGVWVVGDSPQFSALAAKTAPPELVGSALTIMNSIGFALTIPSIMLANYLIEQYQSPQALLFLVVGPIFGLIHIKRLFYIT